MFALVPLTEENLRNDVLGKNPEIAIRLTNSGISCMHEHVAIDLSMQSVQDVIQTKEKFKCMVS